MAWIYYFTYLLCLFELPVHVHFLNNIINVNNAFKIKITIS